MLWEKSFIEINFQQKLKEKVMAEAAKALQERKAAKAKFTRKKNAFFTAVAKKENMGDIVGDLNRRRGQVSDMGDRAGAKTVKATVPLSEMFGYVTTLRTLSSGRATSTMEFSHYAETPSNISEEVIKEAKGVQS